MKFKKIFRSLDISPGPVGAVFLQTLKSNAKKVFLLETEPDTITRLPNYFFNIHQTAPDTITRLPNYFFNIHQTEPTLGCAVNFAPQRSLN